MASTRTTEARGEPSLNQLSVSATLHCMTGCVIGEVIGLAVATAFGWSTAGQIALAVGPAYERVPEFFRPEAQEPPR